MSESTLVEIPADFTVSAYGHTLDAQAIAKMEPAAVLALVRSGFSYALRSAGVLGKEKKAQIGTDAAALKAAQDANRAGRFGDILAGKWGEKRVGGGGVGGASSPLDKIIRQVAVGRLKARALARGVPMPKKDELKRAIAKALEVEGDDIRAEATARLADAQAYAASGAALT